MTDAMGQSATDRMIRVLWADDPQVRRGPKPRLTIQQVVGAGMAIADQEGVGAMTMQRVAARLGSTKMAMYKYVPGRAELLALMLEGALLDPEPSTEPEWRTALAAWTREVHSRALAHPWSVELLQRPHVPGPHELRWLEVGLQALAELPLRDAEKLDVLALLVGHAVSSARQQAGSPSPEGDLRAAVATILAVHGADYRRTAAAFGEARRATDDDAFAFGIERILDGIEVIVLRRRDDDVRASPSHRV